MLVARLKKFLYVVASITLFLSVVPGSPSIAQAQGDPYLVKDMTPGISSSTAYELTAFNGYTYFNEDDGIHGAELWRSDGTEAGTVMIKDIYPGIDGSNPYNFVVFNNSLYFVADDGTSGPELWKTDGTEAGTSMLKDILPGVDGSYPDFLTVCGDFLYFTGESANGGQEIWRTDGTEAGTNGISVPGKVFHELRNYTPLGNYVYFKADVDSGGIYDRGELWRTDGTEAGTTMVKDINPGQYGGVNYTKFVLLNSVIYFIGDSDNMNYELWRTDGTDAGTVMVKDINPGTGPHYIDLTDSYILGGELYFGAYTESTGHEIWKSDGTEAGTVLVKDIYPGSGTADPQPQLIGVFDGNVYFNADDGIHGAELWRTDGTEAGTVLVKDINPGSESSYPKEGVVFDGKLYFNAHTDLYGSELWRTDGTEAGTMMVMDIYPGSTSSSPYYITAAGNHLFFLAEDPTHGVELWAIGSGGGDTPADLTGPSFSNLPGENRQINIDDGQVITINPYVLKVNPTDDTGISKVEFYVNNNLVCDTTLADSTGVYSCSWDTLKYHSDIKVLAYDTGGNASTALTRSTIVRLAGSSAKILPETGANSSLGRNLWPISLFGLALVSGLMLRKKIQKQN